MNRHYTIIVALLAIISLESVAEDRSVGTERALKLVVFGATALNVDEINSIFAGMGNSAVREPIGEAAMEYGHSKSDTYTNGSTTYYGYKSSTDDIRANLIIPVGEEYGLSLHGIQSGATFESDYPSSTVPESISSKAVRGLLFWRNPKDGSYSIGIDHSDYCCDGASNSLNLGYRYRDPLVGGWWASSRNTWAGGRHESTDDVGGRLYWSQLVLTGHVGLDGDRLSASTKYEHDQFSLSASRRRYEDYDYSVFGLDLFVSDNLLLHAGHHGIDSSVNNEYGINYQSPNNDYAVTMHINDNEYSDVDITLGYTINLGRKRSLKAADRDRDPY